MPLDSGKPDLFIKASPEDRIIQRARELIATPHTWCKWARARDRHGIKLWRANSRYAASFCATTALKRATRELGYSSLRYHRVIWQLGGRARIVDVNDFGEKGLAGVHELFDKRLSLAR